jgi:hypothetical protein
MSKTEKNTTDIYGRIQQVYEERTEYKAWVFMWLKQSQDGRENAIDDEKSDHLASSKTDPNVDRVSDFSRKDCSLTVCMIAELNVNRETKRLILAKV